MRALDGQVAISVRHISEVDGRGPVVNLLATETATSWERHYELEIGTEVAFGSRWQYRLSVTRAGRKYPGFAEIHVRGPIEP